MSNDHVQDASPESELGKWISKSLELSSATGNLHTVLPATFPLRVLTLSSLGTPRSLYQYNIPATNDFNHLGESLLVKPHFLRVTNAIEPVSIVLKLTCAVI